MRAPRLVHDQRQRPPVADLGDGPQIGAGTVRRRTRDERALGVGVDLEGLLELLGGRRMREMAHGVPVRLDPDGFDAGKDQPRDHRLVCVPADQQLLVRARHGQHRRLDRQRAPARAEERVLGVHRVGHQFLGALQDTAAGEPVVQPARRQHVTEEDGVTQQGAHLRVGAARLFVPRRTERQPSLPVVVGKGFQYGCSAVLG